MNRRTFLKVAAMSFVDENFSAVKEFYFRGSRTEIKAQAVAETLKLLTEHLA